jgi:hypothetical protein
MNGCEAVMNVTLLQGVMPTIQSAGDDMMTMEALGGVNLVSTLRLFHLQFFV